jgi:hypothetical protein
MDRLRFILISTTSGRASITPSGGPWSVMPPAARRSSTARWLTRDPLGMVDRPNVYAYCGLCPADRVDQMGLDWGHVGKRTAAQRSMAPLKRETIRALIVRKHVWSGPDWVFRKDTE